VKVKIVHSLLDTASIADNKVKLEEFFPSPPESGPIVAIGVLSASSYKGLIDV
jgi:hypothetical protein